MADANATQIYNRMTIIGTGAIGCSVACLIKGRGLAKEVVGVDRVPAHLEMARKLGFIDRGLDDPARGVMGAQGVVIATPLHEVFRVSEKAAPDLRPEVMLTCTAGTTHRIWKQLVSEVPQAGRLVPSFPLVYSASNGPAATSPALLQGRRCLVASSEDFENGATSKVDEFWRALGLETQILDTESFEWAVTAGYFWPQLVASAAATMAQRHGWPLGDAILKRWLDSVVRNKEMERSHQLYASKLSKLLLEMSEELGQLVSRLGGKPPSPVPTDETKDGP
jgi:prephenate dehydrogenase